MNWIKIIQEIIDYCEEHLNEDMDADFFSNLHFVSPFYLQKMFTSFCDITLNEYVRNRRLTLAGYEVLNSEKSILEIAIAYGYESNESFTRAFTRFHGITPSVARKNRLNLNTFSKISLLKKITGGKVLMNTIGERGYVVKETGAVYYTKDMDKTVTWFKEVLGWYGQIEERNEDGIGEYGCVNNIPIEIESLHIAPFTGIHLFSGEAQQKMVGFMLVQGIEKLYEYVRKQGWSQITEIQTKPWGAKICTVTTIDGSKLTFFE